MARISLHLGILGILLAGLLGLSYQTNKVRPRYPLDEYLYLSKYAQMRKFAFGFEGEYADFLFLQSLQSFYQHIFGDQLRGDVPIPFKNIVQVYDTITDLDPHFQEAYQTGALFVAMVQKSSLAGIKLLEAGTQKIPDRPWIWEILGRMYWLERFILEKRNEMTKEVATRKAIEATSKAIELGAGDEARGFLQLLATRDKIASFDEIVWLDIYERAGKNHLLKKLAMNRIHDQILQIQVGWIQSHLKGFHKQHGRWPTQLDELPLVLPQEISEDQIEEVIQKMATIYKENPAEALERVRQYILRQVQVPKSHPYTYNPATGEVTSQKLERQRLKLLIGQVQRMVDHFAFAYQRLPTSLEEVVKPGMLSKLPELPLQKKWTYNPQDGVVGASD